MPKIFWVQFGCNVKTARFWAVFEAKIDENEAFWGIYKGLKIPRTRVRVGSSPTSGTKKSNPERLLFLVPYRKGEEPAPPAVLFL